MKDKRFYENYLDIFLNENSKINLISKNDEKFLWEKHVYDSLAIEYFFEKYNPKISTLLDIGTGGGFPAIPIALTYPKLSVYALDSIKKKICAIEKIKTEVGINNLYPICDRAENIKDKYDIVTSRAVASLDKICNYALPLLKDNGYFVAYKSKKADEEINNARNAIKKYKARLVDIIEYKLPLEENFTRNLIIIQK